MEIEMEQKTTECKDLTDGAASAHAVGCGCRASYFVIGAVGTRAHSCACVRVVDGREADADLAIFADAVYGSRGQLYHHGAGRAHEVRLAGRLVGLLADLTGCASSAFAVGRQCCCRRHVLSGSTRGC